MLSFFFKKFAGRSNRKWLKSCTPTVARINELDESYKALSDSELQSHTEKFRERFQNGETLDDLLPEAFATVKNAARRLLGSTVSVVGQELEWDMVHYDVQLIGGMALHQGRIAEMATGEGKTLVATLPLYLNSLASRNTQLVTVNEYLAQRDSEWMGHIYKFLGLTVGCIKNQQPPDLKREMYGCDITYGTSSEFGFDYLRDNGMAHSKEEQVQRDHFFIIIDEVDSILVDEARTPLIISGPAPIQREQPYTKMKPGIQRLVSKQNKLCNGLISEAKKNLDENSEDTDTWDAGLKMLQVKLGMPKNKQLLRLIENGEYRKLLDKADLEMHSDMNKEKLFQLKEELFYVIDEKQRQADLTEKGRTDLSPDDPDGFTLPDLATRFSQLDKDDSLSQEEKDAIKLQEQEKSEVIGEDIHAVSQLLRAYALYERDVEYVVQEGKVVIVDENTGRIMPGRRWGDGLHQAVEAKEAVTIERESRTYATITVQNYFRMYEKLSGMTGTAETEAMEFKDIYGLGVAIIPTNKPNIRVDDNDVIFKTRREKYNAALDDIEEAHKQGQPVLVGTVSVDASEVLSRMLRRRNIPHNVLNAKYHQQEAEIVTRAGIRGTVTIATNMAGRGTDIKLGDGVKDAGGLLVLGTERHESRRIDRQLRGRCSRQGDPGRTKFFISLEDDLMRLFSNSTMVSKIFQSSVEEGEPMEHPLLNRSIETAQKRVEQQNYSIRKRLLQYDDVLNKQREIIYGIRNDALHSETPHETIFELIEEEVVQRIENLDNSEASLEAFVTWSNSHFPIGLKIEDLQDKESESMLDEVLNRVREAYRIKKTAENKEALLHLERFVLLSAIDGRWQEHLTEMEDLRRSVSLRSYGQKDPLNEYKNEAYTYFQELISNIRTQICSRLFRTATNLVAIENVKSMLAQQAIAHGPGTGPAPELRSASGGQKTEVQLPKVAVKRTAPKVGRNDPCPCGSGKKYKKCCGR